MKLTCKEVFWGIDRRTGRKSEKETANASFPCTVGELPVFGKSSRRFVIDEVSEAGIVLSVHCADEKYNRSWKIEQGETVRYLPRSFDGGYKYELTVQ